MHPLLKKILLEDHLEIKDFDDLQKVPRREIPELDSMRTKKEVWAKFCACRSRDEKQLTRLIREGNRLLKDPHPFVGSPKPTRPRPIPRVLPEASGQLGVLSQNELDVARNLVTMAETNSTVQGSTIEGVRDHPLDTMQIMGIEDSFPAIDLTSLGDLPGILSSINENQPTLPSLKQTATSTEITKRQNQDIPTGLLIQEQSHTGDTPNIPVEEMQPPGPSTQVQPTENPPPDPIEQYLRSVASIVPSERVEPPPLTPLQQELSELTLLPLNRRPRAVKRKATRQPLREIAYSHYYIRPAKPGAFKANRVLPTIPSVCSFLVEELRALPLEVIRRFGHALMTGEPVAPPESPTEPVLVAESVPVILADPNAVTPMEVDLPPVVVGTLDSTEGASAITVDMDTPRFAPRGITMGRMTFSTPEIRPRHFPLPEFTELGEVSAISIPRQNEMSCAEVEMQLPSILSVSGATMPSLHSYLEERLSIGEPTNEKIKFLQDTYKEVQNRNRVPISGIIRREDSRLAAAWKFRFVVEFDCQLWSIEKDEFDSKPTAITKIHLSE